LDTFRGPEYRKLAKAFGDEYELALPGSSSHPRTVPRDLELFAASAVLRCFGQFQLIIRGRSVKLDGVKPRARQALRLLSLHVGTPVHRETLIDSLWPDSDLETGARSLHVAISALRQALEPGVGRGASTFIVRYGDAYTLALPEGARVDVVEFQYAIDQGAVARAVGDISTSISSYQTALDLHEEELLPEDGPAEWVVGERERLRFEALRAAIATAEMWLDRADYGGAAGACQQGLRIDRYQDELWRLCLEAQERAGDRAAAANTRSAYRAVLAELGLSTKSVPSAGTPTTRAN
jgi:DNA-binding SARP family transcriptional activator